ncbi:MAG: Modulator of drug activity B [Candidatus Omnitrophica bacterium ADurb.Bin292]|jgi:NAD(P)H dehydrogenase (quinone)|nr:MAG: Modulator of drug activity B [Candidatus Omnitrophica bacterium ADurb.Bin292]HOG23848.1 NAD(P)H-dependent oxidoreductase [Candidatus Omnitrophota bacterium]HPW76875.1 NAD(P)H-dependent oxidoreductase [Candidatus Omnitrophota bacterium]HQB11921.1 NAD(P)H-dependent oxidoreductase [Candidatus Omnitrophota bacterium]
MNCLIIYSHPNPASFNHAIKEALVKSLKEKGKNVRTRDLYAMRFDPVLKADDFETLSRDKTPRDIEIEQEHIRWADVLVFIYPIWWAGMPAITRGYVDRVLIKGFAYEETPQGSKGLLQAKKVYIINTMGAPLSVYEEMGIFKAMDMIYDQQLFGFCGFKVLGHKYFGSVQSVSDEERKQMLAEIDGIVAGFEG